MPSDRAAAERAILDFLRALDLDPEQDPELAGTPARVAEAFDSDLLSGYRVDSDTLLTSGMCEVGPAGSDSVVVVRDIRIQSMCPHHLLPGLGSATVAYLPGRYLLGIGVIARLAEAHARRLTLQESIGERVVAALMSRAGARGAYCRIDMHHTCLSCRGPRQVDAVVTTTQSAGELAGPRGEQRLYEMLRIGGTGRP